MPRRLLAPAALVLAFALAVALGVHGLSIAAWHGVIDGSAPTEVLLGAPRPIRSDDWKVQLPLAFAQRAHEPAFPLENALVGLGQSALAPIELPVAHPLVAFRPTQWGFFLGPDAGMAWLFWSRVLGLFAVWWGVLRVVAAGRGGLAAAGALAVVAAPFFQFWSFNAAPHAAWAGASFLAAVALVRARGPAAIAASALALAWAGASFALAVYPPYQVTLAWLAVALAVGFAIDARAALPWGQRLCLRALAAAGAALAAAAVLAWFAATAWEAIEAIQATAYPGRRVATGGERTLAQLANATLAAGAWAEGWGSLHNVCEAASFWFLAPAPAALWLWRWARGERVDAVAAALLVYQAVLVAYVVVGFPEWLARASGLALAPGRRAVIGLGLADAALVVRWLACAEPLRREERGRGIAIAAGWTLALAAAAVALARELPGARLAVLLPLAGANGALGYAALAARRRAAPLLVLAAASLASAVWFHPLTVGGARFVLENQLSQRITAIDRAAGGDTVWASFGRDDLANLFRALGVRSVNGLHPIPQLELWRRIDPQGVARPVYDRYAHVAIVAVPTPAPRFRLHSQDYVILELDPGGPALRRLGVSHALFRGDAAERIAFERLAGFERLASVGEDHLYRVLPAP